MILFPDDIQAMNELLTSRSRLDPELLKACQEHIEHEQYADAVFKAFRVLDGRLQQRSGIQGENVGKMLHLGLQADGALTKKLGFSKQQAGNYRDLLVAAFAVFRNPEAHAGEAIFEYGCAECQAVLGFVNLMLSVLDRQAATPLDQMLKQISRDIGPEATDRLAKFLEKVRTLNLHVPKREAGLSFSAWSWRSTDWNVAPKRIRTRVFALYPEAGNPNLFFPTAWMWLRVAGFDHETYTERLRALGCASSPGYKDLWLDLRRHNSASVFDSLYVVVRDVVQAMEATVAAHQGKG